ncbi:MAG: hypothetical protein OEY57_04400 [Nitrospirota bacterium]|nr:hypothetical protein [Nitrospirota bacterium]
MDTHEILKEFAKRFVEKHFRDRFLHEAKKKPQDLHTRICHEIEKVFSSKFAGGSITYQLEDKCLILSGNKIEETTWALAEKQMGLGNGLLIIDATEGKFYAETESGPRNPSKIYSGQS